MKIKLYISLIVSCALFLILSAFLSNGSEVPLQTNKELINFSHSLHSELASCEDCHSTVAASTSLKDRLLPNHDNCVDCHEVDNEEECSTCHINENYEALIQTESKLLFNHKVHVEQGKNCTDCHKGLDKVDYGFESAELNPPMENCSSCHNEVKIASNACESCHITTFDLVPQNHKTVDYMKVHKFKAMEVNANCMMCHENNTCQECHVATIGITENNLPDNFYQPYMPSNTIDGPNQQVINKVHKDLNFRFSHGIDAKGRTSECQTCHQVETFCAECHQSENGDFAVGGIVPTSHLLSDFALPFVGSGGGEHAVLARRDIERCISCHDVQGADPTCIECHHDSDGIKGTNPKTHASNFMRDQDDGDWHENSASVCYNCHTSASPISQQTDGFCNYCHN